MKNTIATKTARDLEPGDRVRMNLGLGFVEMQVIHPPYLHRNGRDVSVLVYLNGSEFRLYLEAGQTVNLS